MKEKLQKTTAAHFAFQKRVDHFVKTVGVQTHIIEENNKTIQNTLDDLKQYISLKVAALNNLQSVPDFN